MLANTIILDAPQAVLPHTLAKARRLLAPMLHTLPLIITASGARLYQLTPHDDDDAKQVRLCLL